MKACWARYSSRRNRSFCSIRCWWLLWCCLCSCGNVSAPEVRAYAVTSLFLLIGYISFYARYTYWAGDFAWGDRYVSTAVEMVALIAVPLLLRYRANLSPWIWRSSMVLIAVSFIIQVASLAFWLPLEIYQMETLGPSHVRDRACAFKNIVAFTLGKMDAWGLNTESMSQDPWDYVHITTWNFLPFLLHRVGAAPRWVVNTAFAVWIREHRIAWPPSCGG